jgi:hypothetical protein
MRDVAVRLHSIYGATEFLTTVLSTEAELKHAPRLLQVAWEHGMDFSTAMRDITHILRSHAFCPSFRCEFIPFKVAMGEASIPGTIRLSLLTQHRYVKSRSYPGWCLT